MVSLSIPISASAVKMAINVDEVLFLDGTKVTVRQVDALMRSWGGVRSFKYYPKDATLVLEKDPLGDLGVDWIGGD